MSWDWDGRCWIGTWTQPSPGLRLGDMKILIHPSTSLAVRMFPATPPNLCSEYRNSLTTSSFLSSVCHTLYIPHPPYSWATGPTHPTGPSRLPSSWGKVPTVWLEASRTHYYLKRYQQQDNYNQLFSFLRNFLANSLVPSIQVRLNSSVSKNRLQLNKWMIKKLQYNRFFYLKNMFNFKTILTSFSPLLISTCCLKVCKPPSIQTKLSKTLKCSNHFTNCSCVVFQAPT